MLSIVAGLDEEAWHRSVVPSGWTPAGLVDLRHIHATILLLSGVPVHVAAARLGHADLAITLRVYAHVIRHRRGSPADIFAGAVKVA